ncbi:unnamed protein product, partial [marine sediment metagenome]
AEFALGAGGVFTYKAVIKNVGEPDSPEKIVGTKQEAAQNIETATTPETVHTDTNMSQRDITSQSEISTAVAETGRVQKTERIKTVDESTSSETDAFEFKPKGVLSGLITDVNTGEPVSDARVHISIRSMYTTETDANGFYYFDKIEQDGNYRIQIASKEYVGIYDYEKQPVVGLKKDKQRVKHFELEKACMIEVRVVDEAGEPVKKARVIATSLADNRRREIGDTVHFQGTDDDGFIMLGGFKPSET